MFRKLLAGVALLGCITGVAFAVYAWKPALEPLPPGESLSFDAQAVERGRVLAAAGYCATCHTSEGGEPWAGNYGMQTGFGTVYSTNITPDPDHGIGRWSEQAFRRAMQEGVSEDGSHLFPAFPYNHFTLMSDRDVDDLYAYIMSEVAPVASETKDNELPFPLDQRLLQAGWKLLFVDFGRHEADETQSPEWNRGDYLVNGVTHCGACHTPRNPLGAEIESARFDGAEINRWTAPALNEKNAAAVVWSARDFSDYLNVGGTALHGIAAGPMGPVVHAGLRELPQTDRDAIGVYLASLSGASNSSADSEPSAVDRDKRSEDIVAASLEAGRPSAHYRQSDGERLYMTACASCHYNSEDIALGRPDLGVNSATRLDEPDNLIHVILHGVGNAEGLQGLVMPGFRDALSDQEIATIAQWLRSSRTSLDPWADVSNTVSKLRTQSTSNH